MTNLPERALTNDAPPPQSSALEHRLLDFPGYRGRGRALAIADHCSMAPRVVLSWRMLWASMPGP